MDFKKIVAELMEAGHTQERLAQECECSQPTISAIHTGETKDPKASIGLKLAFLHDQTFKRRAAVGARR